jgi:hypothetical protein
VNHNSPLENNIAMKCLDQSFWAFLHKERSGAWQDAINAGVKPTDPIGAVVHVVCSLCSVESCFDIKPGTMAARSWEALELSYEDWQHGRKNRRPA